MGEFQGSGLLSSARPLFHLCFVSTIGMSVTIRCKCSFSRDCTVLVPVALTPEITVADLARDFLDRAKKKYPHVFDQFPIFLIKDLI